MAFQSTDQNKPVEKGKVSPKDVPDGDNESPPPTYTRFAEDAELDDALAHLTLSIPTYSGDPEVDTCLAHLKLLHAIQDMKEDVGYTDGLWNIWDGRADYELPNSLESVFSATGRHPQGEEVKRLVASEIREKRWALFVARAVDRYTAWWNSFEKKMMREADMQVVDGYGSTTFINLKERAIPMVWEETMMLPLGK